jgi:PHD/YefM family antitoxin component YafN of YafNO toxin-antitoxin module
VFPITANDLKTKGVAAIESTLAEQTEAMISVRGKDRFVVMDVAHYNYLRECELEAALAQSRADIAAGRFVVESPQAHVDRILGRTKQKTATPAVKKVKRAA